MPAMAFDEKPSKGLLRGSWPNLSSILGRFETPVFEGIEMSDLELREEVPPTVVRLVGRGECWRSSSPDGPDSIAMVFRRRLLFTAVGGDVGVKAAVVDRRACSSSVLSEVCGALLWPVSGARSSRY